MQGALLRIARDDAYTVHEMQSSSGTAVREYVSSTGTVFAVAWQGPWLPDLRQLLGPYFDDYQRALQTASAGAEGARSADDRAAGPHRRRSRAIRAHSPAGRSCRASMPLRVQAEAIR